jgi:hypothetical protein
MRDLEGVDPGAVWPLTVWRIGPQQRGGCGILSGGLGRGHEEADIEDDDDRGCWKGSSRVQYAWSEVRT